MTPLRSPILRRALVAGALLAMLSFAPRLNDAHSARAASQALAQESESLGAALAALAASEVASVQETHYTHRGTIDHANGVYDTDCSGFVDDLLSQVAPAAYALVPVERGRKEPRAYLFEQFFASISAGGVQPGWTTVAALADVQPGDLLAWTLAPFTPESDTGHIVVIAAAPILNRNGTLSLPVYDASSLVHTNDSRVRGVGGVGSGMITFRVDDNGAPTAFQFASRDQFHAVPIAIGRLVANQ